MPRLLPLLLILLIPFTSLSQIVNFKPHHYFHAVPYPEKLAMGDLDKDGLPDVVFDGEYGLFTLIQGELTSFSSSYNWSNMALGDFDGDDDLDVAITTYDSLYILGNVHGVLTEPKKASAYTGPGSAYMMSVDLNRDGRDDLVLTKATDVHILVFSGTPTGVAASAQYMGPGGYVQLAHGDFNGDGHEDMVTINVDRSSFSTWLNQGDGILIGTATYTLPANPVGVAVADVTGDGKPDLVIGNAGTSPAVNLYENTGDGFALKASYANALEYFPISYLTAGDLNGDSYADISFADWEHGVLNVMLNDGAANFGSPVRLDVGGQPGALCVSDFNADGRNDLVVANNAAIQFAKNKGDGTFDLTSYGAGYPVAMAQADFNNDGHPDLVTANPNDDAVKVMLSNGAAQFPTSEMYATGDQPYSLCAADIVGDPNIDLVVANLQDNNVAILEGVGDGTFRLPSKHAASESPVDLAVADYNADGKMDIMTLGTTPVLLLQSATGFEDPITVPGFYRPPHMATGDVNGDNLPDLVLSTETRYSHLYLLINKGDGSFDNPQDLGVLYDEVEAVSISDFTSDGIVDIGYTTSGYFYVLANDASAHFTSHRYTNGLYIARHIVTGDFTGDGEQDVAFGSTTSSAISVLVATKEGSYEEAVMFPYKGDFADMTAGNLDGDDKDDLALCGWPYNYLSVLISLPRFDIITHDTTRYYGDPNPVFKSTVLNWPGPAELDITYQCDATQRSNIGTYAITPLVSDSIRQNFAVVIDPATLQVAPAPLTITALDTVRIPGRDNPIFRASVAGIKNGDVYPFFLYTEARIDSPPGAYTISPIRDRGGDPNYDATFVNGTLFVLWGSSSPPYPNPTEGEFVIYSLETMPYKILASTGMEIQSGTMNEGYNTFHFTAPPGIYMFMTGHSGGHKLIKY